MRKVLLAVAAGCFVLGGIRPARAEADAEAKRIIEKAIEAHGGAAKLAKLRATTWKSKGTFHGPMGDQEFTGEYAVQFPGKCRFDISAGGGFSFVSVLDGTNGWAKFGDQVREMDKGSVAEVKENLYVTWLTTVGPLANAALTLKSLGESRLGDRTVLGVRVSQKGHRDVALYFDKETGLLAKSSTRAKDLFQGGKEVQAEEIYSDYKEFGGVKRPTKVKELKDGKTAVEETRSDYTRSEKLDEKLLAKP